MTILPGLDQPCPLRVSLKLVAEMESVYGSLYRLAEGLLDESLPISSMIGVLKMIYRHAGCRIPEEALDDFLLRQPCTEILASVLLDILEPIDRTELQPPSAQFLDGMIRKFPDEKEPSLKGAGA